MIRPTNKTFNLADYRPEIDKLIRVAKIADTRSYGAVNRLVELARRDLFSVNNSTECAQIVYDAFRGFKNQTIARKFEKDFNAFCGAYCQISDGKSGFKLGYMKEANLVEFKNGVVSKTDQYKFLISSATWRVETLEKGGFRFMDLTLINPPVTDHAAIAKRRYNTVLSALKDLRDSHNDWQDCELSTEIIKLLDGASKALPSLKIGWLEKAMQELEKLNTPKNVTRKVKDKVNV